MLNGGLKKKNRKVYNLFLRSTSLLGDLVLASSIQVLHQILGLNYINFKRECSENYYSYTVNSPYSETLEWKLIGIVSPYSEPLYIVNKMPLKIVFTIWRVRLYSAWHNISKVLRSIAKISEVLLGKTLRYNTLVLLHCLIAFWLLDPLNFYGILI